MSCTKLCEHYPYHYQRMFTKLLKKFKLIGPDVEEDILSDEECINEDLFTLIQDPPVYENILRSG